MMEYVMKRKNLHFSQEIVRFKQNQDSFDFLMEVLHKPLDQSGWKWNRPYYCYLYQRKNLIVFLVAMEEVYDLLPQDNAWQEIRSVMLELYEGESFEELETGSLPDAYFYETYLFMKGITVHQRSRLDGVQ